MEGKKRKRGAAATPKPPKPDGWPSMASDSYVPADVSKVAQTSQLLEHMKIHVLSYGEGQKSKAAVGELVKSLGGQVTIDENRPVDLSLGPPSKPLGHSAWHALILIAFLIA